MSEEMYKEKIKILSNEQLVLLLVTKSGELGMSGLQKIAQLLAPTEFQELELIKAEVLRRLNEK